MTESVARDESPGVRSARRNLVELLAARGVRSRPVLEAMKSVPRDAFVSEGLQEFAWEDTALPIGEEQTISQPLIVALMAEAAEIDAGDRVLEVGTGSGYAAAILARLAHRVYTVERHASLAGTARDRLERLGFQNVEVLHGDGTLGWAEHAPYDAIVVAAGGPEVPEPLLEQLAPGGILVIPVGRTERTQRLLRVRRTADDFREEDLGAVRFVPLVGERGWRQPPSDEGAVRILRECAEPFESLEDFDPGSLAERLSGARVVLVGEASHGTSEFYRLRARLTRTLVEDHGFRIVALEADWPDAAWLDARVRGREPAAGEATGETPFQRFPTWMWRNAETRSFVDWLHRWNADRPLEDRAGIYGLDLYALYASARAVTRYLDGVDPEAARVARERYACLTPWQHDPAAYGRAVLTGQYRACEDEAVEILQALLQRRADYVGAEGWRFLDARENARLVADAEGYYRIMYRGGHQAWNHRDRHMVETLAAVLDWMGPESRAVVWAHNSHVGDHAATELGGQGQVTLGGLARERWGDGVRLVGQGTDRGTVMAAREWDTPGEVRTLRPAWAGSYGMICHETGIPAFAVHLREPVRQALRHELLPPRLHRAVGVIYRPETELQSHYFQAVLPEQFDSWIWVDETSAVRPLARS